MRRPSGWILLTLFLISGASGLIYQVVWSRAMTLVFGSTTQGVATVLAAFMAGLALGSWAASRFGDRLSRPLRTYVVLEAGIAILSLSVLFLMPALDAAYRALYPIVHLSLPALTLLRFVLASAFLLPATTLMGATLPVLSAFTEKRGGVEGEGASALYAANTAGAVVGTAAAGFWLLPAVGMEITALIAAAGNLGAAIGALYLSRRLEGSHTREAPPPADAASGPAAPDEPDPLRAGGLSPGVRVALAAAIAVSGAGAMLLEVGWTRTLSLILGSSTQAFTVMLTTFLIGLAAGSAAASRILGRLRHPIRALALVEVLAGLTVYAGVRLFPELPYAFLVLFRLTQGRPPLFDAGRFALAGSIMLAPTLLLGAAFPLVVRCFRLGAKEAARPVGRLYAVNTLGAIAGSLAAGFLLIPALGLQRTLVAGGFINMAVGIGLVVLSPPALRVAPPGRRGGRLALVGGLVVLLLALPALTPRWNPLLMSSGVFQYAPAFMSDSLTRKDFLDYHAAHRNLFYRDGPTATVAIEKQPPRPDGKVRIALTVNGKVDATSVDDMETQVLMGQLPLLLARSPGRVLAIGWGSGISVGSALSHVGVESLRAIEIEPAVIEASRFFTDYNRDPYRDPRLRLEIDDARHALLVDRNTYDVILSEPSNPWLAGPSRLFTREFFLLAKKRLAPGGVLCQWVQLYALDRDSYFALIRTLEDVFADVAVLKGSHGDTIVMAGDAPIRFDAARIEERMKPSEVASDLARIQMRSAASLLARFRAGGAALRALAGDGPMNTDDNGLVEFAAARSLYGRSEMENDALLAAAPSPALDRTDLSGLPGDDAARFPAALARELLAAGLPDRAREALDRAESGGSLSRSAAADLAMARSSWLARAGRSDEARGKLEEALRLDPGCLPALLGLGRSLLENRDPRAAAKVLARAVEAAPGSSEARVGLGRSLLESGSPREAIEALTAAADLHPDTTIAPSLHLHWGRACHALGDEECAVRQLSAYFYDARGAPRRAEDGIQGAIDLGLAYLALDRRAEALAPFRLAADLGASLAATQRDQADAALARGDLQGYEAHLLLATRWDSRDVQSHYRLGDLMMRSERWPDAWALWSDLLRRLPDDAVALGGAVEALRRLGRPAEAAPMLRRLIDLEEDPARIRQLRQLLIVADAIP